MLLQELRFFSIYLAKINSNDLATRVVRFPLEDFRKIMDFDRLNLQLLKETANSLLQKIVHIPTESGGFIAFQLFKECVVEKDANGEWYVEIDAHDKALPLMFEFKEKYFSYKLWNALNLKSKNQLRMFEILKQYEKKGERTLLLEEL
jgi:plasmid replication initiation protein